MKQINENEFASQVGERVRRRRKELGMRQEDVAKRLNRNINTVSGIEKGKYLASFAQAVSLADALDCSLEWLAGTSSRKEQPSDPFAPLPMMQRRVMNELNALSWKDQREVLTYVRYIAYKRQKGETANAEEDTDE